MSSNTVFTTAQAQALRGKIQQEVAAQDPPAVGIKVASDVWTDFTARGWIKDAKFGLLGTTIGEMDAKAFGESHAQEDSSLKPGEYTVGKRT